MANTTPRLGRPPIVNPRTTIMRTRLTDQETAWIESRARSLGVTISEYLRRQALRGSGIRRGE